VDEGRRKDILTRYRDHSRRFDAAASGREGNPGLTTPFSAVAVAGLETEPSARELEVLQLVANGLTNREISQQLFLSEETVKSHILHLLAKVEARSRADAVVRGLRRGLIS
jgi:DNA-binding NarL/FixJ family response regulator